MMIAAMVTFCTIPSLAFHSTSPCRVMRGRVRQSGRSSGGGYSNGSNNNLPGGVTMQPHPFDLTPVQYFTRAINIRGDINIAYRYFKPTAKNDSDSARSYVPNTSVVVVFLNGLLSHMSGTKTRSLQQYVNERGAGFMCFDYQGHGSSSAKFIDCTMHDWMEDARVMLDHALSLASSAPSPQEGEMNPMKKEPKVILIGSSMGAWIALKLALEGRDSTVEGVVGIGSAIDFTLSTFNQLSEEEQRILLSDNTTNPVVNISSPYLEEPCPFSLALYGSGNEYLLCNNPPGSNDEMYAQAKSQLALDCPVRLLHGLEDDVVRSSKVTRAAEILQLKYHCEDVKVQLLDGGDHRLSRPEDIAVLLEALHEFL